MILPKRDPNYTMAELDEEAALFLAAGRRYYDAAHRAGIYGAIVWASDTEGGLVIFSRGEYRERLLQNIEGAGPVRHFGAARGD